MTEGGLPTIGHQPRKFLFPKRFEQPGCKIYCDLLLKVAQHREYKDDLDFVTNYYGGDLSPTWLDGEQM